MLEQNETEIKFISLWQEKNICREYEFEYNLQKWDIIDQSKEESVFKVALKDY